MAGPVSRVLASLGADVETAASLAGLSSLDGVSIAPAPRWMRKLWVGSVGAMTLGRRVYVHPALLAGDRRRLVNVIVHELVHVRQWSALGGPAFIRLYLSGYLGNRLRGGSHSESYSRIPFEVEARLVGGAIEID